MDYIGAAARAKRLQELIDGKEEFCTCCLKTMGFPKSLHVYAGERFANGARYSEEGGGQTCGPCNREIDKHAVAS